MKKKKIMVLIALSILIAYLASLCVVFGASRQILIEDLNNKVNNFTGATPIDDDGKCSVKNLIDRTLAAELSDNGFSSRFSPYPYAAAVYDTKGNLVARTGSMINVNNEKTGERLYCYLDEYLTSEMKKDIDNFCEGHTDWRYDMTTCNIVFDFNIENDTVVPVKLYFQNYYNTEGITLKFSDDKAQYTVDLADGDKTYSMGAVYLVDIDESSYNHSLYKKFYKKIEGNWLKKLIKDDELYFWTGTGDNDNEEVSSFLQFKLRDEYYYIYEVSAFRPILGTITSGVFKTFFIQETVLFAVIGIALLLATGIIFNKNERIEKSRLAFTSAAAHELKTPLAVISNQCECIIENVMPKKNDEYVRSIYDETRRMNKLVAILLQYNRLNSLKSISKENEDIVEIINNELHKYSALIEDKNIETQVDAKEGIKIKCNAELIGLVIDNFLSNAIKHSPDNGLIKLSVKPDKKKVAVTVFNKGNAIKRGDAKHIWEEFYREDKARNSKENSTGMGLAICRRILELHKFKYGFKNVDGGVEFSFTAK